MRGAQPRPGRRATPPPGDPPRVDLGQLSSNSASTCARRARVSRTSATRSASEPDHTPPANAADTAAATGPYSDAESGIAPGSGSRVVALVMRSL